jgi:hypothetical protein
MENSRLTARKIFLVRMIFSLLGVASLIVMVWGLRVLIAHGGVKGADPSALFSTVFGFAGLALA